MNVQGDASGRSNCKADCTDFTKLLTRKHEVVGKFSKWTISDNPLRVDDTHRQTVYLPANNVVTTG